MYDLIMDEQPEKSPHAEAAASQPHDAHGHFAPKPKPQPEQPGQSTNSPAPQLSPNPLTSFFHQQTKVSKTVNDDTLVDVHIGNPLRRITMLLEEIKRQKAFTFNIKGSLGMAGILLVLATFGIFGGTKALCNKGEQSHIGMIMQLNLPEPLPVPSILERALNAWSTLTGNTTQIQSATHNRLVLVKQDQTVFHILDAIPSNVLFVSNVPYILTGDIDNCSQTITLKTPNAIQEYPDNNL